MAGNPLNGFIGTSPTWIGLNYRQDDGRTPDHERWDIAVIADDLVPADVAAVPGEPSVVFWLQHVNANATNDQGAWLGRVFPGWNPTIIPFSHGPDVNQRYFGIIAEMPGATNSNSYHQLRDELDRRLLGRDLTDNAVRYLYALALAMRRHDLWVEDLKDHPRKEEFQEACLAAKKLEQMLCESLGLLGNAGAESTKVIKENASKLNDAVGVSQEQYRTIRDDLSALCPV